MEFKDCHCKYSEKIDTLSRAKFSLGASRCKQVGVSAVQTRKSQHDWSSYRAGRWAAAQAAGHSRLLGTAKAA